MELEIAAQNKQLKYQIVDIVLLLVVVALYFTQWINFTYKLPFIALIIIGITFYKSKSIHESGFLCKVSMLALWHSKKNIYALILKHALIDTFGLYQIYLGNY